MTPPLRVDSPSTRLEARRLLRDHGITAHIVGDVLWVTDDQGQRMRVNDGEWLVYEGGAFTVKAAVTDAGTITA